MANYNTVTHAPQYWATLLDAVQRDDKVIRERAIRIIPLLQIFNDLLDWPNIDPQRMQQLDADIGAQIEVLEAQLQPCQDRPKKFIIIDNQYQIFKTDTVTKEDLQNSVSGEIIILNVADMTCHVSGDNWTVLDDWEERDEQ